MIFCSGSLSENSIAFVFSNSVVISCLTYSISSACSAKNSFSFSASSSLSLLMSSMLFLVATCVVIGCQASIYFLVPLARFFPFSMGILRICIIVCICPFDIIILCVIISLDSASNILLFLRISRLTFVSIFESKYLQLSGFLLRQMLHLFTV